MRLPRASGKAARREREVKSRRAGPVRVTPILLLQRAHLPFWLEISNREDAGRQLSSAAARVVQYLRDYGASFLTDLVQGTGLLRTQVETALGELVAHGRVTADGFAGLRSLISPNTKRRPHRATRRIANWSPADGAGRWALLHRPASATPTDDLGRPDRQRIEIIAHTLLRRYGVVFRRVLERETSLPAWRDLLTVYRRLEARGELRGGRFVQGFSGEQFALPEALASLRQVRRNPEEAELVALSGADPLNLTGIITPGKRLPANAGNRVLYRHGVPVALSIGRQVEILGEVDPAVEWELRQCLLRQQRPAALHTPIGRLPS